MILLWRKNSKHKLVPYLFIIIIFFGWENLKISRLRAYLKVNMDNARPDQAIVDPSPSQLSGYILVCFGAQVANIQIKFSLLTTSTIVVTWAAQGALTINTNFVGKEETRLGSSLKDSKTGSAGNHLPELIGRCFLHITRSSGRASRPGLLRPCLDSVELKFSWTKL